MNCRKCGNEITNEVVCPSCGEEVAEKRIKKRVLIPVVSAVIVIIMGISMFLVGNVAERNRLEKALETDEWFTVVGENEFVVIKFEDGRFASSKVSGVESDADIETDSYEAVSENRFKIGDTVYMVDFDDVGMEVSPGIADKSAKSELWYHIEE